MDKPAEKKTSTELARELIARCHDGLDRRSPEFRRLYEEICARMKEENAPGLPGLLKPGEKPAVEEISQTP